MQAARRTDDDLEPSPINPAWVREGTPQARSLKWGSSADGLTGTYVWSCTAGTFDWTFGCDEIVHVVEGAVTVTSPEGVTRTLEAGDSGFFPRGTTWLWHVPVYVRKHAVLVTPLPKPLRAGLAAARTAKNRAASAGIDGQRAKLGLVGVGAAATGAAGLVVAELTGLGALLGL